jgi:hypothetical protein
MDSNDETLQQNTMYLASAVEKKIIEHKGILPRSEQTTLARNLGALLTSAKKMGIKKSDIVLDSGIPCNKYAPVNVLNSYCILSEEKDKRKSKARLCAHPKNYLKLALTASRLMGIAPQDAILRLTEGSNSFGADGEIDEEIFAPAKAVWKLLASKLAVIVERQKLKDFFREAYDCYASYDEDIFESETWKQDKLLSPSTSYWPSVYLCAVSRNSKPALFKTDYSDEKTRGTMHAIEQVYLTLGWDPDGWVVGYFEVLPGVALESHGFKDKKILFDFHCSGDTFTRGYICGVHYEIENEEFLVISDSAKNWPYRLRSRVRFERLSPHQVAQILLDSEWLRTPDPNLVPGIDTTAVMSPPKSPLAMMEAQLIGRKAEFPNREITYFLEEFESKIVLLKKSFRTWRNTQQESARRDYIAELEKSAEELALLRGRK